MSPVVILCTLLMLTLSLEQGAAWLPVLPSARKSQQQTSSVKKTQSFMSPPQKSNAKERSSRIGTIDIPIDTFGDVNHGHLEDESKLAYYNNDASQTIFPFLDHWKLIEEDDDDDGDGSTSLSLVGIVYNHPTYKDGEAIATSPLLLEDNDGITSEEIVTTTTGSQYLLGNELVVSIKDWTLTEDNCVQGVVAYSFPHVVDIQEGQQITTSPITTMAGKTVQEGSVVTTENGSHYHLMEPLSFPIIEQWKRLEGGSIAGYVYHHKNIADGEIITTTPLVELDESNAGLILVTTASGSQYQLGEAEPEKQQPQDEVDVVEEDKYYYEDEGVYYGQEDDEDVEEEVEEDEIPTYHIPPTLSPQKSPLAKKKSNPLEQIFATAFEHHQKIVEGIQEQQQKNNNKKQQKELAASLATDGSLTSADDSASPVNSVDVANATSWSNRTVWGH